MFRWEGGRWLLKRSRPTFRGSQVRQWSCPYFEVRGGDGGFDDMSFPDSLERAEKWVHTRSQNKWHSTFNPPISWCALYPINSSASLLIVKLPEYFKASNTLLVPLRLLFCHFQFIIVSAPESITGCPKKNALSEPRLLQCCSRPS